MSNDIEISKKHLVFESIPSQQKIVVTNRGSNVKKFQFRLYNLQWYDIQPNQFNLQGNESKEIMINLKKFDCQDDFIYLKGDGYDQRITISMNNEINTSDEIQRSSKRLEDYLQNPFQQEHNNSSPQFQSKERDIEEDSFRGIRMDLQSNDKPVDNQDMMILIDQLNMYKQKNNELRIQLEHQQNIFDDIDKNLLKSKDKEIENVMRLNENLVQETQLLRENVAEQDYQIQELKSQGDFYYKLSLNQENTELNKLSIKDLQVQLTLSKNEIVCLEDNLNRERKQNQQKSFVSEQQSYVTLYKRYEQSVNQVKKQEDQISKLNEEISLLTKRLERQDFGLQSCLNISQDESESRDKVVQIVQRLNQRITQLKIREDGLLEENAKLEDRLNEAYQQNSYNPPVRGDSQQIPDSFIRREFQILESSKQALEERFTKIIESENQLMTQMEQLKREKKIQDDHMEMLQEENNKLQMDAKRQKELFTQIKSQQLEYEAQVYALEKTLHETTNRTEVSQQIKQMREKELKLVHDEYRGQLSTQDTEIERLKKIIVQLKQEVQNHLEQIHNIRENLDRELQNQKQFDNRLLIQQNEKLQQINRSNGDEIERTKFDLINLKERTEREIKKRDQNEQTLKDQLMVVQQQLASVMAEKANGYSTSRQEINKLSEQHKTHIKSLISDNKSLEKNVIEMSNELQAQGSQFTQREQQLLEQVQEMSGNLQRVMEKKRSKQTRFSEEKNKPNRSRSPHENGCTLQGGRSQKQHDNIQNRDLVDSQRINQAQMKEERRRFDQNLEEMKDKNTQLQRELSDTKQLYAQSMLVKANPPQDYKITNEINDIKQSMGSLKYEKERVTQQIMMRDEQIRDLQNSINQMMVEMRNKEEYSKQQEQKSQKSYQDYQYTIDQLHSDMEKQRTELDILNEQLIIKIHENRIYMQERKELNEKVIYQQQDIEELKQVKSIEQEQNEKKINNLMQVNEQIIYDHEENMKNIQQLKLLSQQQKEIYEKTIYKLNTTISLLKEKFQNDLQELQTRQNIYFNQNNPIKLSLTLQKENQQLITTIQAYSDNIMTLVNNQTKLKLAQEKNKQLQNTIITLKDSLLNKNQQVDTLKLQNEELSKKVEKFRPKFPNQQRRPESSSSQRIEVNDTKGSTSVVCQEGEVAKLQAEINYEQTKLSLANTTIDQLTCVNRGMEVDMRNLQNQVKILQDSIKQQEANVINMQRQHKHDREVTIKNLSNVQQKMVSEEKVFALQEVISQRDQTIKELQNDLQRSREFKHQVRNEREDRDNQIEVMRVEIETLRDEIEKQKKTSREHMRKDSNYKEFKDKLDQSKQGEKNLTEEVKQLIEKLKVCKIDLQRKESIIKELRDKIDELMVLKTKQQDNDDLQKQMKYLKEESQRKDQSIKYYKTKLEEKNTQYDNLKIESAAKLQQSIQNIDNEQRKLEHIRIQSKKQENLVNMFLFLLKRLYRENHISLQKQRQKSIARTSVSDKTVVPQTKGNFSQYSESMNILNLSPDDLEDFLEPQNRFDANRSEAKKSVVVQGDEMDKFEQEISNLDNLNVNNLYELINSLIQERVKLKN